MPDYSWHLPQRCGHMSQTIHTRVSSSSGAGQYSVYVSGQAADCTCPGWRFHGKCRHVEQVRAQRCTWKLGTGPHQTLQQNVACTCPACGAETELVA